jgi:hypothetical protein
MHITPLAWFGIIFILLVIVLLNLGLVALIRGRATFEIKRPMPRRPLPTIHKFQDVLRDPFGEERKQMEELSHLVEKIIAQPGDHTGQDEDD